MPTTKPQPPADQPRNKGGRPPSAAGPTPAKVRQSKFLRELRTAGGDKVCANLTAEPLGQLNGIMRHFGTLNRTEGVTLALSIAAKSLAAAEKRRAAKTPR